MRGTAMTTTLALGFHLAVLAGPAAAAPGDLDPAFGDGGTVVTPGSGEAHDAAIQSDGKIVAVGVATVADRSVFSLARYLPDGQLDPSFGGDGTVLTDVGCFGTSNGMVGPIGGRATTVVIQTVEEQGAAVEKILVGGGRSCGHTDDARQWVVARYQPDGSLDATFGVNGFVDLPSGEVTMGTRITDLALDPLGRIVAAGWISLEVPTFGLARLLPNGTPDPSFGEGGMVFTRLRGGANAVAMTTVRVNGTDVDRIVAAGVTSTDVALAGFLPNGAPDPTFGTNGSTRVDVRSFDGAEDLEVQGDGKLVVAAGEQLARFLPDGTLDASFGVDGVTPDMTRDAPNGGSHKTDVAVQDDGNIVAAGWAYTPDAEVYAFAVSRHLSNGEFDPSFGGGTVVTTTIGERSRSATVALQPDGMIVLAGGAGWTVHGFALARYQAVGPPPIVPEAASLTATGGNASVHLEWTTPPNGGSPISGYRIYRGTTSGGETLLTTVGRVSSFDDTGAVNGTRYFYRVSAVNAVGEGALSNEVSATPATVPGAPSLSAASARPKGVSLSWTTPADGGSPISGYRIYRGTTSGGQTLLTSVGTVATYKDTKTRKGTTYYYVVRAVNAVGEGPPSNEASARAS